MSWAGAGSERPSRGRATFNRSLAALCASALLAGGCASQLQADKHQEWVGRKFADVIDTVDKAFGESRIEDREQIVRAKLGIKAEKREHDPTDWSIPANFRIPLPALERRFNLFIEAVAAPETDDVGNMNAVTESEESSITATVLRRLTDNSDLGAALGIHGGPDIGPELFIRYDRKLLPWAFFGEQRGYWRTDNGWGGVTKFSIDYRLADESSFIRFGNKAEYYEELQDVNLTSGLAYRRVFPGNRAISLETGVEYNPYAGDPGTDQPTTGEEDDDNYFVRLRGVSRAWRPWIEVEVKPGYYYRWEHDDPWGWGIDVRVSFIYESFLRGEE